MAESILELVAELRSYLGSENGMLVRGDEIISFRPSELMCDLFATMERLSELVERMKAAADAFGGGNGGCAAIDAQLAVALWLGARGRDRLLWLDLVLRDPSDVCYHGKQVLDDDNARRCRVPPPESVGRAGDALPKYRMRRLRIGRLLRAQYYKSKEKLAIKASMSQSTAEKFYSEPPSDYSRGTI